MLDQRRHQYLHAMGISVWQARASSSTDTLEETSRVNSEQSADTPHAASPEKSPAKPPVTSPEASPNTQHEKPPKAQPNQTPAARQQPNQWLIWVDQQSAEQHTAIVGDLQALCHHAMPDGQPPAIIHQQPDDLPDNIALLGIGLSDENQRWLARQPNHLISIPAIADWHNQPATKQQVWRKLLEGLW